MGVVGVVGGVGVVGFGGVVRSAAVVGVRDEDRAAGEASFFNQS